MMMMTNISWKHRVQYYETDQMAIVHHSNYIRWFEESRVEFLDKIGYSYAHLEELGIISPVLSIECDYKKVTKFGEEVIIIPTVTAFNGVKLSISYTITSADTGEIHATGKSCHCFLNSEGFPIRLKKEFPDFYQCLCDLTVSADTSR